MRGLLTVIEGLDGSGKGTQTELLHNHILGKGQMAYATHYPTYETTDLGKLILEMLKGETVLLSRKHYDSLVKYATPTELSELKQELIEKSIHREQPAVLQALFAVDRYQVDGEARNLLESSHLIFDRYYHSSLVYGQATGVDPRWLEAINEAVLQPDLAIFLDVTPEESVVRRPERRDKFEKDPELMRRVLMGYRELWVDRQVRRGLNYHIVDGERDPELVHQDILKLWEATYAKYRGSTP